MNTTLQRGQLVPLFANGHNFPGVRLDLGGSLVDLAQTFHPDLVCLALDEHGNMIGEANWTTLQTPDKAVMFTRSFPELGMNDIALISPQSASPDIAALYFGIRSPEVTPERRSFQSVGSVECVLQSTGSDNGPQLIGHFAVDGLDGNQGAVLLGLLRGKGLWHAQIVGVPVPIAVGTVQLLRTAQECLWSLG